MGSFAMANSSTGKYRIRPFLILGAALALLLHFCFSAAASDLRVTIEGVESSSGTLMVGLYDSEEHFRTAITNAGKVGLLNDRSRLVGISMRAIAGTQSVVFTDLKPGAYAVIAFHDANDNGKLTENWLGKPTECYGFSNNAGGFLSAPSFKNASVLVGGYNLSIVVTLKCPQ
jgi:uncharacterized protein (DUF2141 family)